MNQTDRQLAENGDAAPDPAAPEHDCKWFADSRTVRLNALAAAVGVLEANTGLLRELLGPQAYIWALISLAVANAVLRTLTAQPLRLKRNPVTGTAGNPME